MDVSKNRGTPKWMVYGSIFFHTLDSQICFLIGVAWTGSNSLPPDARSMYGIGIFTYKTGSSFGGVNNVGKYTVRPIGEHLGTFYSSKIYLTIPFIHFLGDFSCDLAMGNHSSTGYEHKKHVIFMTPKVLRLGFLSYVGIYPTHPGIPVANKG